MDHAATTPVDKEVVNAMLPYFSQKYGNASSIHSFGMDAFEALSESRKKVADLIHAREQEIIFTAGGTESDNMAIKGIAYNNKDKISLDGPHIITSEIEHPAVLETCRYLEKQGFKIKYLPVDKYGIVNIDELEKSISKDTFLISIMYANNEIGTIEPIKEIGHIAKENDIVFHTDAVQAIGKTPIDVNKSNIDLLSISSHKIYGPKGVGALFIGEGIRLQPIIHGGGHERGLRSSTENIPGIVGFGKACELAETRIEKDAKYLTQLRDKLINGVLEIEESYLNGHPTKRLANNAHFRFTGIEGESLVLSLSDRGIAAATGSACSSKKLKSSHVLAAIGVDPEHAHGSLRFSLGRENTEEEISYVIDVLPSIVERLRKMSPLWNKMENKYS
ncbi:MAG: cysteine desulfurase NifS [Candidatus Asgardarchaeum californiense]|nr:MAG: cysteine desulfurase NifS [Candidatus Asgardarchaeum californiense]